MSNEITVELGRYEFGKNGRVVLSRSARPITYYTRSWWTYTWVTCAVSDGEGCAAITHAALSLDQPPPLLRSPPIQAPVLESAPSTLTANPPVKKALTQTESDALLLMKAIRMAESVRTWWNKPFPPPMPPKPASADKPVVTKSSSAPVIPSFDIQQIPDVMERLKLPVSAQMMRHWFAGQANYSTNKDDMIAGVDQSGNPYPSNMIDQSIVKLDWVLGFPRAQKAYDELLSTGIYKPNAAAIVKQKLLAHLACLANPFAPLNSLMASARDIHRLHADFQFQRVDVDAERLEKVIQWLAGDAGTIKVPDDLTGALGSFSIYAALGNVRFNHASRVARVESIYIYVRDSYGFRDDDVSQSQYLGHWNVDGVYLAPLPAVSQSGLGRWISAPLANIKRSIYERGAIMYPVSNKSFRDWRARHIQGGDFIAYTRPRHIRLTRDLLVNL